MAQPSQSSLTAPIFSPTHVKKVLASANKKFRQSSKETKVAYREIVEEVLEILNLNSNHKFHFSKTDGYVLYLPGNDGEDREPEVVQPLPLENEPPSPPPEPPHPPPPQPPLRVLRTRIPHPPRFHEESFGSQSRSRGRGGGRGGGRTGRTYRRINSSGRNASSATNDEEDRTSVSRVRGSLLMRVASERQPRAEESERQRVAADSVNESERQPPDESERQESERQPRAEESERQPLLAEEREIDSRENDPASDDEHPHIEKQSEDEVKRSLFDRIPDCMLFLGFVVSLLKQFPTPTQELLISDIMLQAGQFVSLNFGVEVVMSGSSVTELTHIANSLLERFKTRINIKFEGNAFKIGSTLPEILDIIKLLDDTRGAATASRQGEKLEITDEYFQRHTRALVIRLRQHEDCVMREGTGLAGMRQRDLIQFSKMRKTSIALLKRLQLKWGE